VLVQGIGARKLMLRPPQWKPNPKKGITVFTGAVIKY
jgi:hypothetical protein